MDQKRTIIFLSGFSTYIFKIDQFPFLSEIAPTPKSFSMFLNNTSIVIQGFMDLSAHFGEGTGLQLWSWGVSSFTPRHTASLCPYHTLIFAYKI